MPNARNTGHRIRSGIQAAASVTSSYAVELLPVQSDMNGDAELWAVAGDGSTPPRPARVVTNADLSVSADGFQSFEFRFSYLTFGMFKYLIDTFLPGGVQAADVTVMTYDHNDEPVYLQALIYRPQLGADMQYAPGGYMNAIFRFRRGVIIT